MMNQERLIVVRGGGDLATGVIQKLYRAGFPVLVLEIARPLAIRRQVALSEAVYAGEKTVEDVTAVLVPDLAAAWVQIESGKVAMMVDPQAAVLKQIKPLAMVDAILAKRNLGTCRQMAAITIALGPGFTAGQDVDVVIETLRGHDLGRLIFSGAALPDTGVPGLIAGAAQARVIHAATDGVFRPHKAIGDTVKAGEIIATIGDEPVLATLDGVIRGLIRDGFPVASGLKLADIDPRESERQNCLTISDKARCIGGGVLEAILLLERRLHGRGTGDLS